MIGTACAVLHTDTAGNPVPCPDGIRYIDNLGNPVPAPAPGKQSREFIDGYGLGYSHGQQAAREQAKYWEGFDRGVERGREMAAA